MEMLTMSGYDQFWLTILGAFFGALFGVGIPYFYLNLKNGIAIRLALKSEITYNSSRLAILTRLIGVSGVPSDIATRISRGYPINIGSSVAYHPFSLKICSTRVFDEKWVEISQLRESFVIRIKKYYEDIEELQRFTDFIFERVKPGNFDNDNAFIYLFVRQKELSRESQRMLDDFHELQCFGLYNAICQKIFLR